MSTIRSFEEMEAWQAARDLTTRVYDHSSEGAFARDFGTSDQMRPAAFSIMSNIAGFESRTEILFLEFLGRTTGSAGEFHARLYVAHDAGYISEDQFRLLQDLCTKCSSQITRFMDNPGRTNHKRSDVSTFRHSDYSPKWFQRSS